MLPDVDAPAGALSSGLTAKHSARWAISDERTKSVITGRNPATIWLRTSIRARTSRASASEASAGSMASRRHRQGHLHGGRPIAGHVVWPISHLSVSALRHSSMDTRRAEALPGVSAILRYDDPELPPLADLGGHAPALCPCCRRLPTSREKK